MAPKVRAAASAEIDMPVPSEALSLYFGRYDPRAH